MVAVGVPGAFSELSYFAKKIKDNGETAVSEFNAEGKTHFTFSELSKKLFGLPISTGDHKISLNLFNTYYNWISSDADAQPGTGVSVDYASVIYGTDGLLLSMDNDIFVSTADQAEIYSNINSGNKTIKSFSADHFEMTHDSGIKNYINKVLNKIIFR